MTFGRLTVEWVGDGVFLKAPLIGEAMLSRSLGCSWDRPAELRTIREEFLRREVVS